MPSNVFWEDDPQLYWAYRIFYLKKMEIESKQQTELLKHSVWLNGNANYTATSLSLNNAFSKKKKDYPSFDEMFEKGTKKQEKKTRKEINKIVQDEYNAWARY